MSKEEKSVEQIEFEKIAGEAAKEVNELLSSKGLVLSIQMIYGDSGITAKPVIIKDPNA